MWFPAQWPETYSYTLSAALQYGLPVVVPNIGAFGERLIGRKFSRIINWDISFQRMSELWRQAIADFDGFFQQQSVDPMPDVSSETRVDHFYQDYYIRDSWWRESEFGRIDFKTLIDSFYSSENITIAEEKYLNRKEGRKIIGCIMDVAAKSCIILGNQTYPLPFATICETTTIASCITRNCSISIGSPN